MNRINDWIGHRADVVNTSSGLRNFGWKFYLEEIMKDEIGPLRKINAAIMMQTSTAAFRSMILLASCWCWLGPLLELAALLSKNMTGLSLDWIALTVLRSLQVWKKIIEIDTTNMMNAAAVA